MTLSGMIKERLSGLILIAISIISFIKIQLDSPSYMHQSCCTVEVNLVDILLPLLTVVCFFCGTMLLINKELF